MATHTKAYTQSYRVADSSLAQYELYVGEDALPDYDDSLQPVASAAALPISWTPPTPSSGQTTELNCVVRQRNQYNLLSQNQYPTIVEINELGEEELGPLTVPEILQVIDGAAGELIAFARYPRDVDRNEADTWELYVELGIDPDPDLDTPVLVESFLLPRAEYRWRALKGGFTPGATYHVMVVVRRSDDSTDTVIGQSEVSQYVLASTYDMNLEDTLLFGGQEYEAGL